MRIAIGSDHKGRPLKEHFKRLMVELGHEVTDLGTHSEKRVDYPDIAAAVAQSVARRDNDTGIAICGTGIGVSIAANKVHGIRAALCHDAYTARMARQHNDANVLCLGALAVGEGVAEDILLTWLGAAYDGGRHQVRIDKIAALEV